MAKQIIVLDVSASHHGGWQRVRTALWFTVSVGQEAPIPGLASSAYEQASPAEVAALQAGTVREEVLTMELPNSMSTANIQSIFLAMYTDRAAYLATVPQKGKFYGAFYDGTWNAKPA